MKTFFQRITTEDGLELHGLLFEPEKRTAKALIHIHGWAGNFYENKFIDYIAKKATSEGFAFLTFNNRGAGIINDFIRREGLKVNYLRVGGSLENFKNCIFDIKAIVDFLSDKGYEKMILQGHSLGCQKALFYDNKTKDKRINGLVLLAPVDDISFTKRELKDRYEEGLKIAREMAKEGRDYKPVPEWMAFYPCLNGDMFLSVADPDSNSGKLFNYPGQLEAVKSINCQALVIFGSEDDYQADPEDKLRILKENIKNCDIKLLQNAGHGFVGFEEELSSEIVNWLKKI